MIDQTVIVLLLQLQIAIRKIENFVFFKVKKWQFASVASGELLLWELSVKLLDSIIKFCGALSKCIAMATKTSVKFSHKKAKWWIMADMISYKWSTFSIKYIEIN